MSLTPAQQRQLALATRAEIRFDDLTRHLYATDASIYQIVPAGVAFPKTAEEAADVLRAAAEAGLSIIPRGAGTGLAGGAVGDGLVVDFARHTRGITDLNLDARSVRVGAGVVLDQLNDFLRPHGLWFGPDVATSSRATLGGMIANNSSGARAPVYGTTAEHVQSLEIVLADGRIVTIGARHDGLAELRAAVDRIVAPHAEAIRTRLHEGIPKRWPGYGLDRYLRSGGDLTRLVVGSEGTLAGIVSAELRLVPLPKRRGLGIVFFTSVAQAMQVAVELLDLGAAAIEHLDRLLFDQTRGQAAFRAARALLDLDGRPCESMLLVEFFDDVDDKLDELSRRPVGQRTLICKDEAGQQLVWALRKQGLSLLTACPGPAKPMPGIEDVCVPPPRLAEYVRELESMFRRMGLEASYYGHAGAGGLHVRPKLNLRTADDLAKYRSIAEEVAALCRQFKGSLAAEHGVGIARSEFMPGQLGPELLDAMSRVKQLFDPRGVLNPGKIIPDGRFRIDTNLRYGVGQRIELPLRPVLGFVERDRSFAGNLEQCNGCGECRKGPPTMCPTYLATGEEVMSTRGRANIIRAVLERRLDGNGDPLACPELETVLGDCLSCKACKSECPSNVDLALLKAELNHARHRARGVPLVDRVIARADLLGRLACGPHAVIVNAGLRTGPARRLMERILGLAAERTLPPYATQRFDRWFARRPRNAQAPRRRVILWDDTWVRYHEPHVGRAAVQVLEAAGLEVVLEAHRRCCGRPAFSRGLLDEARKLGTHNVGVFRRRGGTEPIVFLEPSCYTMFIDEYRQLGIPGADEVARRCVLFEPFMFEWLRREPAAVPWRKGAIGLVAIHAHCHAKALTDVSILPKLVACVPGAGAEVLPTGCCGMAGAFGLLKSKQELSGEIARNLLDAIDRLEPGTILIATGTSCRHQIRHFTAHQPLHMAELLARALRVV